MAEVPDINSDHLSDDDLLLRLSNTEDNFVERKRFSDDRQWLRTAVAFANSCPIGYPGILFIGVYDNGTPENPKNPVNLDSLQKTLNERISDYGPQFISCPEFFARMDNNSWRSWCREARYDPTLQGNPLFVSVPKQGRPVNLSLLNWWRKDKLNRMKS